MAETQHGELGDFLRSRRRRLGPRDVGLAPGRRRRTEGLRREEVAELAGIGVDWYTRLEQGRAVTPSVTTIDALARALRLGKAEHAHLKALAGRDGRPAFAREAVPAALHRLIESLPQPAYVTGRRWDVLAWNAAAAELLAFDRFDEADRNVLVCMLTKRASRRLFGSAWADEARRMLAEFRGTYDLWADDPAFRDLIERLRRDSPEFPALWRAHDIHRGGAGLKILHHPTLGERAFEYVTFQANDDPALKLAIYMPRPAAAAAPPPPRRAAT